MRKIRVTIKDAMAFFDADRVDFVPNLSYTPVNTMVFEVPDDWIAVGGLVDGKIERVYADLYGEDWRSGNADGSRYEVLECKVEVLAPGDATLAKSTLTK